MQLDPLFRAGRHLQGSASSGELVGLHAFAASGSQPADTLLDKSANSLGASNLSFERAFKNSAVVLAFASTATFATDAAFANALAPTGLEVVGEHRSSVIEQPIDRETVAAERRSLASIVSALDEEPIEDGITHRAQHALVEHINEFGTVGFASYVAALFPAARAASLLRLFGRSEKIGTELHKALLAWGLASTSVEVRDAAIQAAENWGDDDLIGLLSRHQEPVVWLGSYAARVVRDLGG
jgi:hypothetical protein